MGYLETSRMDKDSFFLTISQGETCSYNTCLNVCEVWAKPMRAYLRYLRVKFFIFRKQSTLGMQFYLIVISIDLKTCVKDQGGSFSRLREKRIWLACIEVPLLNYCLVITVFLTTKTLSQNISKTLLQILFKLLEHWTSIGKKVPCEWLSKKKLRAPRNTAVSKIINAVAMTTSWCQQKMLITNFLLFLIKLWWFFVIGKAIYAPICEVLALKNPNESP